jgi:hypothetical protein
VRLRPPRKGNKLVPNYQKYCWAKYGDPEASEDGRPSTFFKGAKDSLLHRLKRFHREEDLIYEDD